MRSVGDIALDAEVRAIASGAITDGAPVAVNSTGTVSAVAISGNAAGSQTEFNDANPYSNVPVFVPSENKIALHSIYVGGGGGAFRMTTISGTTPSFATANVYQASNISPGEAAGVTICSSNASDLDRVLVTYKDTGNSNYGTAIVYKPSDGTFGSKVVFESAAAEYMAATYDSNSDRVVINYKDSGNSNYGTAIVGAVSGTSVSFGTAVVYNAATTVYQASTFDSNSNKVVILYQDGGNSERFTTIVGTVDNSDNSISFGSEVAVSAGGARSQGNQNIAFDTNSNKVLVAYRDNADSAKLKLVVGTVSGTSISFGTILDAGITAGVDFIAVAFNPDRNKFGVAFQRANPVRDCAVLEATISGTDVTVTSPMSVNGGASTFDSGTNGLVTMVGMAYDTNVDKFLVAYKDDDNGVKGEAQVLTAPFQEKNLTSENFIGFAHAAYADGQKATVKTTGSIARNIPQQAQAAAYGSVVQFDAGNLSSENASSLAFDSNSNKVVLAYRDNGNSNYGTALVGTIDASDNSISWGSAVIFESAATTEIATAFDSNSNKVVIAYKDSGNSDQGTALVGTVSGTSISFGSTAIFNGGTTDGTTATFDSSNNKVIITYQDGGNSNYGTAVVGTVSGTSISFGSEVVFNSENSVQQSGTFDTSNNKFVIAYLNHDQSRGEARVGTVSGTGISFGSATTFNNASTLYTSATFDTSNNKIVIAYQDAGNSSAGTAIVGTVSGTSISFGSEATFNGSTAFIGITFDSTNNKSLIAYRDNADNNNGTIIEGTVSGTSISFGSENKYTTGGSVNTYNNRITYDSNAKRAVVAYTEGGASGRGDSRVFSPDTNVDLTIGQQYFVQTDGTLGTSADSPSVIAGTAIGASDIIVKG